MLSHDPDIQTTPDAVQQRLTEMIRRVEAGCSEGREAGMGEEMGQGMGRGCVQTGWDAVDRSLPVLSADGSRGLARGAVHEWMGLGDGVGDGGNGRREKLSNEHAWLPPLDLLAHLASCAAREGEAVAWVGRRCWPHPCSQRALRPTLVDHSIFIEPENASQRQWAIELCLRSPAVCAVVADASSLSMAESRRLQLAAEAGCRAGGGGFALLTRPERDAGAISAATTRWIVRRERTPASFLHAQPQPRWRVEQRRCKGIATQIDAAPEQKTQQGIEQGMKRKMAVKKVRQGTELEMAGKMGWILEGGHETGVICLSSDVVDRSGPSQAIAQSA